VVPGTAPFPPLTLGKWNMVHVSFLTTLKDQGFSKIIVNGASNEATYTQITNTLPYSSCLTSSAFTVGNGFIGELKRIQVYSPAAYRPNDSKLVDSVFSLS